MALDTSSPRSRRTLLAAGLGGLGLFAAQGLGRPAAVRALDPNDVVKNTDNPVTATTSLTNSSNSAPVFKALSTSGIGLFGHSTSSYGVYAYSASSIGVYGDSHSGTGVRGSSISGSGVTGNSSSGYGVAGNSTSTYGVYGGSASSTGVYGIGFANTGVQGYSGAFGTQPAAPAKTGVYGYAAQDADARGVIGQTTVGQGVRGEATTSGTGGYFTAPATTGTALQVSGKTKFSRSARTSVAAGQSSRVITMAGVTTSSYIIATVQTNSAGVYVRAVKPAAGSFRIYLSKTVAATTYVGYLVIN